MDGGVTTDESAQVAAAASLDFDAFVSARAAGLLRFAYLMSGSVDAAEEALQSALAKACEHWSRVRRADDPEAYVRRMIVNEHVSWWRRFRRHDVPVAEVRTTGLTGDPADAVTNADLAWRLCASLPARQRAVIVLRYYEGLTNAEIADQLGCPETTVRSAIHRALGRLRALVEEEGQDHG
jgi:RNA polymerase sigma-70 factor (sigma-E family)